MSSRPAQPWFFDPLLWLTMAIIGGMLMLLSLARYWGYNALMLDLGNMSQAIWSATHGQPLVFTQPTGAYSRLAGHVEFFYFLLAPLYLLWPNPQILLISQALLATAGAIPAYRLALRQLDSRFAARCSALIYLLYPVMQTAVLFDLHGDTLAMPLLLFALDALDRKDWRSYGLWLALALSCKVYVAAPVAGIGAYLWLWGSERRVGLITLFAAVGYGGVVFFGVREWFASPQLEHSAATAYVRHYYSDLHLITESLLPRLLHGMVVFGPLLLLLWRGWRWLLPALPLSAAVLLSTGPGPSYHYAAHHYALVVPFLVMAVLDGAARDQARGLLTGQTWRWRANLGLSTLLVLVMGSLMVDQPLNPRFWQAPPGNGLHHWAYGVMPRDAVTTRFLAQHVPPDVPVVASVNLATRLINRETVHIVRHPDSKYEDHFLKVLDHVDYVVINTLFDWRTNTTYEQKELGYMLQDASFGLVAARDGLVVFERAAPPATHLQQTVRLTTTNPLPAVTHALGPAQLRGVELLPLEGRRFRASFVWQLQGPPPEDDWVAISQLGERSDARIVHLPTYASLPISTWPSETLVWETFEFIVPDDLPAGSYPWHVAWYPTTDPATPFVDVAVATDLVVATLEVR